MKTEAGQGGKRGHSNMSHWSHTEWIKREAKKIRRANDRVLTVEDVSCCTISAGYSAAALKQAACLSATHHSPQAAIDLAASWDRASRRHETDEHVPALSDPIPLFCSHEAHRAL